MRAGETLAACLARELGKNWASARASPTKIFSVAHDYPDRRVELHFLACELEGEPTPLLGQEMRWVARADLPSLEFPPADAELIRILTGL